MLDDQYRYSYGPYLYHYAAVYILLDENIFTCIRKIPSLKGIPFIGQHLLPYLISEQILSV